MAISDIFNKYKMLDRKVGHSKSRFPLHVFFKTLATVAALQNYLIVRGLLVTRKRQR